MSKSRPATPTRAELSAISEPHERLRRLVESGAAMIDRQTLAVVLGIEPNTIEKRRKRGWMPDPAGHFGRSPYWTPETVRALIDEQERRRRREPAAAG